MTTDYIEKELKILDINIYKLKECLLKHGAKQTFSGNRYFITYDFSDNYLVKNDILLRVTTDALYTNKAKVSTHIDNTSSVRKVIKFYTDNKTDIENMFYALGLIPKTRVASYRDSFVWNDINLDIDQFPGIPPFVEIECDNIAENIQNIQDVLGLRNYKTVNIGTEEIYKEYGIDYYERFSFSKSIDYEYWDVYDDRLKKTNKIICYGQENELLKGEYYLHFHVLLMNQDGNCLVTQRAWNSRHYPGEWELVGGHVISNETVEAAIIREIQEEIGIDISTATQIYLGKEINDKRIDLIYAIKSNFSWNDLEIEKAEIEKIKLVRASEMLDIVSTQCGHNKNHRYLLQYGVNILND